MSKGQDTPNGPQGVVGGYDTPKVAQLRPPAPTPPEAYQEALQRLWEAMCLAGTILPDAAVAYRVLFQTGAVTAPFGPHGEHTVKILADLKQRLEEHLEKGRPGPRAA